MVEGWRNVIVRDSNEKFESKTVGEDGADGEPEAKTPSIT